MPLAPGAWLNHYEVLGHLGTGGMGEVYRARDNKLQREVALKVLPQAFAQDLERLARFRREAQVLAQVNHVNVAAIYSVEESGGTHFLVMELAEGETLRDRIRRGPVSLEESLDIVNQIAAGLEAAHEKPIVHRDLKPANVKVTPEGVVKILDFGLARAFAGDTGSSDPADSPTLTNMTQPGTILGTAAYMSPEQARGRKVDKRTDIWALGCVLYELLTGKWVFAHPSRDRKQTGVPKAGHPEERSDEGPALSPPPRSNDPSDTVADILGAVIHKDPDWSSLPAATPPNVRFVLRRCLEKDAKRRFHAATDVAIALEEPWTVSTAEAAPTPAAPPRPLWQRAIPVTVAVVVTAIVASLAVWNLRPAPSPPLVARTVIPLPANEPLAITAFAANYPLVALSPDGTQLAYVVGTLGSQQLYLRAMDSLEAKPIPGTEGAMGPFFSPDSQWIGFISGGALRKVSVSGGGALILAGDSNAQGAAWGPDDTIVFARSATGGLFQISAAGGTPLELTKLQEGERSHRWPQFLPDGKTIIFTVISEGNTEDSLITAQRLDTGERRVLIRGAFNAQYVPTGHLVYYRAGTVMAVPFDSDRLEVMGTPAPVLEGVLGTFASTSGGQYSFSGQGLLVYVPGSGQADAEGKLVWVDRNGTEEPLGAPSRAYQNPRLSPDGRRIAFTIREANPDVWVYEIARQALSRFTFDEEEDERPIWTPDGMWLTFSSDRPDGRILFRKPADGGGEAEPLVTLQEHAHGVSWSPDGRVLAIETTVSSRDVWMLPSEGDRKPTRFLSAPFSEGSPLFSPDGRWIAYVSDESGRGEVYVQPYPGPGGKWQVSTEGGAEPVWARSGRELFYRNGNQMMAVEVATQPTFSPGSPKLLFEGQYGSFGPLANYDVSPDGQRFLMIKGDEQTQAATQINAVLNWFEELKRLAPAP